MKQLFEFFPIVVFVLIYQFYEDIPAHWIEQANQIPHLSFDPQNEKDAILFATFCLILSSIVLTALQWLLFKEVKKMQIIGLVALVLLGGATLLLRDPNYLIWKVTLVNWLFAIVFLGSEWLGKTPIVKLMFGQHLNVDAAIWKSSNRQWAFFFAALGVINLVVAWGFSQSTWVNFKLFGNLGLTFAFIIYQVTYLQKHHREEEASPH